MKKIAEYSIVIIALILFSCSKPPVENFDLMKNIGDDEDSLSKPIYITSTLPIDSADVQKLIYEYDRLDATAYPEKLEIYARVFDSAGHFITNMADPYKKNKNIKYFTRVKEHLGKEYKTRDVEINDFTVREYGANDSIPYHIFLTVDYSGSMTGVMGAIYEGTELFISMKEPQDRICLASFNNKTDIKVPFLTDKKAILDLYRAKKSQGTGRYSAVYDAVQLGIDLFDESSKKDPRVIVVFSDGDDNYSKIEIGDLIEKAREAKVHVFSVAFGYSDDENLRHLSKYTGGKFYKAYSKEQLVSVFRDIYMSLRYHYLISYKPPKYWGYHHSYSELVVPGRKDTLVADGEYDTSDLYPWDDLTKKPPFTRPILFDFDSAVVKPESFPILDEIADVMYSAPKLRIQIEGHTDNVGTAEYNQKLSERRAEAVMKALIERGVESRRLRARGFGMSQPVSDNDSKEGQAKNRRTQFRIIAK